MAQAAPLQPLAPVQAPAAPSVSGSAPPPASQATPPAPPRRAPVEVDFQVATDDIEAMFAADDGAGGDGDDDDAGFDIMLDDDELEAGPELPEDGFEIIVDDEARGQNSTRLIKTSPVSACSVTVDRTSRD